MGLYIGKTRIISVTNDIRLHNYRENTVNNVVTTL